MSQTIQAIYENGVLKPIEKVHFREHEKVLLKIAKKTAVDETRGIIKVSNIKFVKKLIESDEFSFIES